MSNHPPSTGSATNSASPARSGSAASVILSTCPRSVARELAQLLVGGRFAACVNIVDKVTSIYRWEGAVETEEEAMLVIKTTAAAIPRLRAKLLDAHPYDVPEILEITVDGGNPNYLMWLDTVVENSAE